MPKVAKLLRQQDLAKLGEGTHALGGVPGLHLQVIGDSRTYVMRMTVDGRRRVMGMGSASTMMLGQARDRALEIRAQVAKGVDPIAARQERKTEAVRKAAQDTTFQDALDAYLEMREATWKPGGKSSAQWRASLETHASKLLAKRVAAVTDDDVIAVLKPIWTALPETASRVRQRIESLIDYAVAEGWRDPGANPARLKGHVALRLADQKAVRKQSGKSAHFPAVQVKDVEAFVTELKGKSGMGAKALRFVLLTASRSGAVRLATWGQIDFGAKVWTCPAETMKTGEAHRVPLSEQAIVMLKEMKPGKPNQLIFPAPRGGPLSDMALSEVMRGMEFYDADGRRAVPHGLRSTFANWGLEAGHAFELVDRALAHKPASQVTQAYFRSDLLEQRRPLMQAWAEYSDSGVGL